eukprot:scpid87447/ scgid17195/ 
MYYKVEMSAKPQRSTNQFASIGSRSMTKGTTTMKQKKTKFMKNTSRSPHYHPHGPQPYDGISTPAELLITCTPCTYFPYGLVRAAYARVACMIVTEDMDKRSRHSVKTVRRSMQHSLNKLLRLKNKCDNPTP